MDLIPFYIKRKVQLDSLKRKLDNSSPLKTKTLELLTKEAEEIVIENIENNYDNSTFEERFTRYIEEIENEQKKEKR